MYKTILAIILLVTGVYLGYHMGKYRANIHYTKNLECITNIYCGIDTLTYPWYCICMSNNQYDNLALLEYKSIFGIFPTTDEELLVLALIKAGLILECVGK